MIYAIEIHETEAFGECRNLPRHVQKVNGKIQMFDFFYPDGDPDHSPNAMGSKLDQDTSDLVHKDPTMSICIVLLTDKQS